MYSEIAAGWYNQGSSIKMQKAIEWKTKYNFSEGNGKAGAHKTHKTLNIKKESIRTTKST
jgi:hypothetical protein